MEDSFRVRVDKAFGALGGNTPLSGGVSPSLWCLTDEEIERREWNRHKEEEDEGDNAVDSRTAGVSNQLESDLQDLSDSEDEEEEDGEEIDGEKKKRHRNNSSSAETSLDDYLDVQANIGRDCTLDYEEEEDEYDKVAVGTEQKGDRIYMRDVKYDNYGIDELSAYGELPNSFQAAVRDPRANHMAAKMRLKEDAEAAGNFDTLQLSDNSATANAGRTEDLKKGEVEGDNPKPILKKRENLMDSRSQKRVRFMIDPKSSNQTHEEDQSPRTSDLASEPRSRDDRAMPNQESDLSQYSSGVPDYVRNPSKYTRYTFDSTEDMDDQSNRKAYMDFFQYLRKRNADPLVDDTPAERPKSITFIPKRKPEDSSVARRSEGELNTRDDLKNKGWSIGVTAEDNQESEVSAMEEDEPCVAVDKVCSIHKPSRQYRTRTNIDAD